MTQAPRKRGPQKETAERILNAAKELVAVKGPYATTVRDISEASGANIAAVNYYFQSKEALVWTATQQIGEDINSAREALLDGFLREAGDNPLQPRKILEALIAPILTVSRSADGGSLYLRNIYTMRTVPYATDNERNFNRHDHVARRFVDEIQRTFPNLNREQAVWRYEFARGSAIHMLANLDPASRRFERLLLPKGEPLDTASLTLEDKHVNRVIGLILSGFDENQSINGF
jgi:AcrR family transcriptional regulator